MLLSELLSVIVFIWLSEIVRVDFLIWFVFGSDLIFQVCRVIARADVCVAQIWTG